MNEGFDRGDRAGVYLKPMLRTSRGELAGGALITLEGAGETIAYDDVDARLRGERAPAVFTPPVFAGDAVRGTKNPLFALRALREFVELCLDCAPSTRRRR